MIALWLLLGCPQPTDDSGAVPDSPTDTDTPPADTGETAAPVTPCLLAPTPSTGDVCVAQAACTFTGSQSYAYYGYALDAGGDADADGFADLVVGVPGWDAADGTRDVGRARVYSGGGLAESGSDAVLGHLVGAAEYTYTGHAVAWAGDMTGDGVDDLIVTSRGHDTALDEAGQVALVAGVAGGWQGWELSADATWVGGTAYARAGQAVQPLGDTDGDGLADLLVTTDFRVWDGDSESYSGGGAAVIRGATDLVAVDQSLADADAVLAPEDSYGAAGLALAAGDFDGDGLADAAVSAPYAAAYDGVVYALPGATLTGAVELGDAPVRIVGERAYEVLGWRLAAGDFDDDGADDLVIGLPLSDSPLPEAGQVLVYAGGAGFFDGAPTPMATLDGTWDHQEAGTGLAVGDTNGDGVDDLLLGAVTAYQGLVTKGGRVGVILGTAGGWTDTAPAVEVHGAGSKDYLGSALDAADLDGDGAAEILLGAAYANSNGTDAGAVYLLGSLQ